jgi:tetratricopeptide (TPR) repeat protein
VAAAAIVLLTLIGGIVGTTWEAHKARVERVKAERRFNDVRTLVNSRLFQLHDEIEKLAGSTRARELLVKQTLDYLDRVSSEASGDVSLQQEIATAYEKLGDVQSKLNGPNLGDTKGALDSYRKALEIRNPLFTANPNDLLTGLALAMAYDRVGDMLSKTNDAGGALNSHRKSLELTKKLAAANQPQARGALGYSYLMVGRAELEIGDLPAALGNFRNSQAIREALSSENPNDDSLRRGLVSSYDGVAFVLSLNGKPNEALAYYRKSQAIIESLVAANPSNIDFRRAMMDTYEWVGITFGELGDNTQGLEYHRKALALCQKQLALDPANAQARDDIADVYHEIGNTLIRLGKPKDALDNFRKSLENYKALSDADPADTNARRQVYATYRQMGNALLLTSNVQGALESYRKALLVFQELSQADPNNTETQYDVALSYRKIGEALTRNGDVASALDNYRQALPGFEALVARSPANAKTRTDLALTYYDLGMARSKFEPAKSQSEDRWREARGWYQKSLDIYQDMKSKGTLNGTDAGKPDELAKEIAKCDAALKISN